MTDSITKVRKPRAKADLPNQSKGDVVVEKEASVHAHSAVAAYEASFEGPIPPPKILEGYEKVLPGAAERILRMAEIEQQQRHLLESRDLQSHIDQNNALQQVEVGRITGIFRSDRRGQYLGASVSILALLGAVYSVYIGAPWQATLAFLSLPVLGMVKAIRSSTKNEHIPVDDETSKVN